MSDNECFMDIKIEENRQKKKGSKELVSSLSLSRIS